VNALSSVENKETNEKYEEQEQQQLGRSYLLHPYDVIFFLIIIIFASLFPLIFRVKELKSKNCHYINSSLAQ